MPIVINELIEERVDAFVSAFSQGAEMEPFRVNKRLPPKKTRSKKGGSMWSSKTEARRLIRLRRKALEAMKSPPFTGDIRLTLSVHVGCQASVVIKAGEKGFGDLDNFVSGVCDGLMAAARGAKIHPLFCEPKNDDVHPTKTIAIEDDSRVMEIVAKKCIGPGDHCWYEIGLEEMEGE